MREGQEILSAKVGEAIHPLTGIMIPIFVASYVLEDYGTGAVMGVPSSDERDQRLADKEGIPYSEEDASLFKTLTESTLKEARITKSKGVALRDWLISR